MNKDIKIIISIVISSLLLFVSFIGRLHLFDWDEINFAESAREMLITGNYLTVQIFFEPFWEKPPLFIWFQALSMHVFGVNEFAARFPNAIAGTITLLALFLLGKRVVNRRFGVVWTIAYGASLLPFIYFKSGIIDPWFNLFIFLGLVYYVFAQQQSDNKKKYVLVILSAIFMGLAVLTKGPAAILMFGLAVVVLLLFSTFKLHLKFGHILTYFIVFIFVGGFWFILQILNGNWNTVVEFIVYQIRLFKTEDAGHGGFPLYHFAILFFGVFPAAIFAIYAHKKNNLYNSNINYFRRSMLILFWVVLILFSIVKTKIVHYSSLAYFPLSFLAAYSVYAIIEEKRKVPLWIIIVQLSTSVLFSIIIILFPVFDKKKQWFIDNGKITHSFTIGNLQANLEWSGWEWLIGVVFLIGIIFSLIWIRNGLLKKGFIAMSVSSILFIYLITLFIVPKVEKYSQNSAIEFMKSKRDKDVYLGTLYKSYAMLFYTNAKPSENKNSLKIGWQLTGNIDKDAFFVVRKDKLQNNLSRYKDLEIIDEKNGYVFLKRPSTITDKK